MIVGDYFWTGKVGTYFWVDPQEELIAIPATQGFETGPALRPFVRSISRSPTDNDGAQQTKPTAGAGEVLRIQQA